MKLNGIVGKWHASKSVAATGVVATMCAVLPLAADTVTYTGTASQHYNDPTAWSVQEVPHSGNDYVSNAELRSPTSAADGVFNGNSLTLGTTGQAKLELYGPYAEFKNDGLSIVNAIITQRYTTPGADGRIVTELAGTLTTIIGQSRAYITTGSANQTLRITAKLVGEKASYGFRVRSSASIANGNKTNDFVTFEGDLTDFKGVIQLLQDSANRPIVGAFGPSPFPGSVQLYSINSFVRTLTPSNDANLAKLAFNSKDDTITGSGIYPQIVAGATPTCGTIRVSNTLTIRNNVHVCAEFTDEPPSFPGLAHRWPLLTCPTSAGTIDVANFSLELRGLVNAPASAFSLDAVTEDGQSTLYLVKTAWDSVDKDVVVATWTGAGLDNAISTAGNWLEGLPDFTTGETLPTFATGGSEALVAGAVKFNGFRFSGGDFAVRPADASADVTMYTQGIAAAAPGAGAAPVYTVAVPLRPTGSQDWDIPSGTTLAVAAPLMAAGVDPYAVKAYGGGTCRFSGGEGATFNGTLSFSNVVVRAGGMTPFGTSDANVSFMFGSALSANGLYAGNCTFSNAFTFSSLTTANVNYIFVTNGTVNFTGPVTINSGAARPKFEAGTKGVFSGGITVASGFCPTGNGEIVITNKPVHANGQFQTDANVTLAVSGNKAVNDFGLTMQYSGSHVLRLAVPNAIDDTVPLTMIGSRNIMDICGCDQTIGTLTMDVAGTAVITNSGAAATLHVVQKRDNVRPGSAPMAMITGDLRGPISLWKSGAAVLAVTNTAVSAVGTIRVTEGTLKFFDNASWTNATAVSVAGADAVVEINQAKTFSRDVAMSMADGGTAKIAAGVVQRVGSVTVDGTSLKAGLWRAGATYSPETRTTPVITGEGFLYIPGDGIIIVVR